jgi:predicted Zn-dependent protease
MQSFLFSIVILLSVSAYAAPTPVVRINLYRGVAPLSASKAEANYVWKYSVRKVRRELNVRIVTRHKGEIQQPNHDVNQYDPVDIYDALSFDIEPYTRTTKYPVFLLSAPPRDSGGTYYVLGVARGYVCEHLEYSHGVAAIVPAENKPSPYAQSITAAAHETCHLLGCHHTEDGIMYFNALSLLKPENNYELYFNDQNRKEVKQCVRRYEKANKN